MSRYALILNPMAGRGRGKKVESLLVEQLRSNLGPGDLFITRYPNHAREIAQKIKNDYEIIVAAGGDGTVHEVVNGMMNGKAVLAVVPIGSGNDFTKMLNMPKEIPESVKVIARNQRLRIDIGKVGEEYFPNGLGIGFDAWVVQESQKIKKLRGFLIYLYSVLKTTFKYRNQRITLHANGKTEERDIFLIAVGNGKAMGGGFFLTPEAQIADGELDVCIIHALTKREVFLNLPKAINGAHGEMPQVEMFRTRELFIETPTGIAAHADGELLGMNLKEIRVSLLPRALEVIWNPVEKER